MKLTEIIQTETTNEHCIYLYLHEDEVWKCYGYSALILHELYPNILYREKDLLNTGTCLPVMVIDYMTLSHLVECIPPLEKSERKIVVEIPQSLRFMCIEKA